MVSATGFRFAGGNCCCCWDYYVQTAQDGRHQQGYRRIKSRGDYPGNKVQVDLSRVAGLPPDTAQAGRLRMFRPDYRNKMCFFLARPFPTVSSTIGTIVKCDASLDKKDRIHTYESTNAPGFGQMLPSVLCCDYVNQRVVYTKNVSSTFLRTSASGYQIYSGIQQIRRVDYDGNNDTLLHEETREYANDAAFGIRFMVYEPGENRVYFTVEHMQEFPLDINLYSRIKSVSADDGSGETACVVREDAVSLNGNWSFGGLDYSGRNKKIVWSEVWSGDGIYKIYYADLDGGNQTEILNTGAASLQCLHVQYNEKGDYVSYERQLSDPLLRTFVRRVDWGGANDQSLFHNRQGEFLSPQSLKLDPIGHHYGCGLEFTGSQYVGGG